MDKKSLQIYSFLGLILIITIVVALMFFPFLSSMVLAITFVVLFEPVHNKLLKLARGQRNIATLATILVILIIVLVPLTFIGIKVFDQAQDVYLKITETSAKTNPLTKIEKIAETQLEKIFPKLNISLNLSDTAHSFFKWLSTKTGRIFQGLASIITSFLLSLLAIYYIFKDGDKLKKLIFGLSPLSGKQSEEIFSKLKLAIKSVIQGNIIVAITQGLLAGIGFAIFGVPNAALWGFVTAIAAFVPIVGTSLVFVPLIIYLFAFDTLFSAIGLLAWGMLAVGLIDNFLGPKLIQRRIQIHNFLILLSVLGGVSLFGAMGFLIGPFCLALLAALINIYPQLVLQKEGVATEN
mgnify:FL=1